MHVKLEPGYEIDISSSLMDEVEGDLREELFGSPIVPISDTSGTSSDEDLLSRMSTSYEGDAFTNGYLQNGYSPKTASTSSTCSDSSVSMGQLLTESDYQSSLLSNMEENMVGVNFEDVMDLKREPCASEDWDMKLFPECNNTSDSLWNILCGEDVKPNLMNSNPILETPPITPPEGTILQEGSPPYSPTDTGTFPKLGTTPEKFIIKSSTDSKMSNPSIIKRKIALAPKAQPIKFVAITSNGVTVPKLTPLKNANSTIISKNSTSVYTSGSSSVAVSSNVHPVISQSPLPIIAPALPSTSKQNSIDLRALKRQQRMIKNRESASLSRKKKKMYVQTLEEENAKLKEQNQNLLNRVASLEKECNFLRASNKKSSIVPKTTAIYGLALLFFLNFSYLFTSFRLLSTENNSTASSTLWTVPRGDIPSPIPVEGQMPPLRSLLWLESSKSQESSVYNSSHKCPLYFNASDSLRIQDELSNWFDVKANTKAPPSNEIKQRNKYHPKTKFSREEALSTEPDGLHLQELLNIEEGLITSYDARAYKYFYHSEQNSKRNFDGSDPTVFPSILDAIKRKDDTYYVVSLSKDHFLIPALSRNSTARAKMSLVMTNPLNQTYDENQISFIQIDCEVTQTRLVKVSKEFRTNQTDGKHDSRWGASLSTTTVQEKPYQKFKRRRKYAKGMEDNNS